MQFFILLHIRRLWENTVTDELNEKEWRGAVQEPGGGGPTHDV